MIELMTIKAACVRLKFYTGAPLSKNGRREFVYNRLLDGQLRAVAVVPGLAKQIPLSSAFWTKVAFDEFLEGTTATEAFSRQANFLEDELTNEMIQNANDPAIVGHLARTLARRKWCELKIESQTWHALLGERGWLKSEPIADPRQRSRGRPPKETWDAAMVALAALMMLDLRKQKPWASMESYARSVVEEIDDAPDEKALAKIAAKIRDEFEKLKSEESSK